MSGSIAAQIQPRPPDPASLPYCDARQLRLHSDQFEVDRATMDTSVRSGALPMMQHPKSPTHDEIRRMVVDRPRRGVDAAINAIGALGNQHAPRDLLDALASAVYAARGLEAPNGAATFLDLGRRKLGQGDRRFVAAVVLRVLAHNPHAFPTDALRNYLRKLFDEWLPERFVAALDLPEDTFERRLVELPNVVPEAERRFQALLNSLDGPATMRQVQSEFHRVRQDPLVTAVIVPFLPSDLLESEFTGLAKKVAACVDLTSEDAGRRYAAAVAALRSYRDTARAHDSDYAERYLECMADVLLVSLERAYLESPASRPADIVVRGPRKRFPLHREEAQLNLDLTLINTTGGLATAVQIEFAEGGRVEALDPVLLLGDLAGAQRAITVPALVMAAGEQATIEYQLTWHNSDGSSGELVDQLILRPQDPNVDWKRFASLNPYPGHAVSDDRLLAGRGRLLDDLAALAAGSEVGSTRISGQKRVGKSSLVRSLQSRLLRLPDAPLIVAYADVNKLGVSEGNPDEAIDALLREIVRAVRKVDDGCAQIPLPEQSEGVQGFADFLSEVQACQPRRKLLIIVDEFDELPNRVFERGGPGDAFFRILKAFSSEGECGFFLVGGERLELALSRQADRLNAFREHHVDYIGDEDPQDFYSLVQRPVAGYLEFDDEAVEDLRSRTGGHPYYTLLVCREILARALANFDAHVTEREVDDSYQAALEKAPASAFAHVWFDHVFDAPANVDAIAERRVRLLTAWARCLRSRTPVTVDVLAEPARELGLDLHATRQEVHELRARGIAREQDGHLVATSRFFQDWLKDWGPERIRLRDSDSGIFDALELRAEEVRVKTEEIRELRDRWPLYRSERIEIESIRAWLEQFGPDVLNQRLAFKVLQATRFVGNVELRQLLSTVHMHARRDTKVRIETQRFRREFAVVYMEPDGKSASGVAKQYCHANKIHSTCITHASRLMAKLDQLDVQLHGDQVQRVIIIDDFAGTGETATKRLSEVEGPVRLAAERTGRDVMLGFVCAFDDAMERIQSFINEQELPVELATGEILGAADQCFSSDAGIFCGEEERLVARRLFEEAGRRIGSPEPLGTGGLEALVVFEHNCPNNTLPVIWKAADGWTPLFERLTAA